MSSKVTEQIILPAHNCMTEEDVWIRRIVYNGIERSLAMQRAEQNDAINCALYMIYGLHGKDLA